MAKNRQITKEDRTYRKAENNPIFKTKVEYSFTEYETRGGITADVLIKKLNMRRVSKSKHKTG